MIGMVAENLTKLGQSVAESMRNSPGLLAMVILQGLTLGAVAYQANRRAQDMVEERQAFAAERKLFIEQCVIPRTKE